MPTAPGEKRLSVALYCHNRDGLGHIIRSIRIAEALLATGIFRPILLTGCRALEALHLPAGVDVHPLTPIPADRFDPAQYRVLSERTKQIRTFLLEVRPNMLLVDTLPLGYRNELREPLELIRINTVSTFCVLGLPYPAPGLDDIFKSSRDRAAFSAYGHGLIYNDDEDETAYRSFPFPLDKVGIVAGPPPEVRGDSKAVLVLGGGGAVSMTLLQPLISATERIRAEGYTVRFVVGPLADMKEMQAQAGMAKNLELVSVLTVEEAVEDARLVIARCGYNTAATLVRTNLPLIFIPYGEHPGDEQMVRAKNLSALENIIAIDPKAEGLSSRLEAAIDELIDKPHAERQARLRFDGARRAAEYLVKLAGIKKDRTINQS